MNSICICVATMRNESVPGEIPTFLTNASTHIPVYVRDNREINLGVVHSYDWLYRKSTEDILVLSHDDVIMREEGWNERVLREFEDQSVGILGFGGAQWHGTPNLYKVPYHLPNLRRGEYLSNVDDAEVHGERYTEACDVVVCDGFVLCIRRRFLDRIDGWQTLMRGGIDFINYDNIICALARRYHYRIRVVGIKCMHTGGGTSTKVNPDRQKEYDYSHRWMYENFKDVLPARV